MPHDNTGTIKIEKTRLRELFLSGDSPQKLALASFLGIVIGTSPLLGFHFAIALVCAGALRLNLAVMYLFANISIPPIAPLIVFASIQLGHLLIHGQFLALPHSFSVTDALNWMGYWWLGSLILGQIVGVLVAGLVFVFSRSFINRRLRGTNNKLVSFSDAMMTMCKKLKGVELGEAIHAFCKCTFDPVFEQLWSLVGDNTSVCDLGGGRGYFLSMYGQRSPALLTLVEWDQDKLDVARQLLPAQATIIAGDVRAWRTAEQFDVVLMIDILHYLETSEQFALIDIAITRIRSGGRLIIRDMDSDRRIMVRLTKLFEVFCLRLGITRGERINPRPISEIADHITNHKFAVEIRDSSAGIGFANALIIATKK